MSTAFDSAISGAADDAAGYATTALPLVASVAVALLGLTWVKKIIGKFR
jgi:hypothetical protein